MPEPFNEHTPALVITGSSNLTDAGIGAGNNYNYEFNVQLTEYEEVKFATDEFDKIARIYGVENIEINTTSNKILEKPILIISESFE